MAYRKKPDDGTFVTEFGDDSDYPGLNVTLRRMSVSAWLEATGMTISEDGLTVNQLLGGIVTMSKHLVAWDLEEADGTPVPVEQALDQDRNLLTDIYTRWVSGATGVPAPLDGDSPSGPPLVQDVPLQTESL